MFLLDDHEIVRRGVADLIDAEDGLIVIGQWGGAVGALERIAASAPDVAVIDVRLGDGSGIEVCRDVRSSLPEVGCLILTSFSDDQALVDASLAGAAGYLLKQVRGNPSSRRSVPSRVDRSCWTRRRSASHCGGCVRASPERSPS